MGLPDGEVVAAELVGRDPGTDIALLRTDAGLTPPAWADGVVYVATLNAPTDLSPDVPSYIGSRLGTAPAQAQTVVQAAVRLTL